MKDLVLLQVVIPYSLLNLEFPETRTLHVFSANTLLGGAVIQNPIQKYCW